MCTSIFYDPLFCFAIQRLGILPKEPLEIISVTSRPRFEIRAANFALPNFTVSQIQLGQWLQPKVSYEATFISLFSFVQTKQSPRPTSQLETITYRINKSSVYSFLVSLFIYATKYLRTNFPNIGGCG